jgi:hypothetical protein
MNGDWPMAGRIGQKDAPVTTLRLVRCWSIAAVVPLLLDW